MPILRVTWEIDLDILNNTIEEMAQDAAALALEIMQDPESTATVFTVEGVIDELPFCKKVDLMKNLITDDDGIHFPVKLTYFKESGKYYSTGEYNTTFKATEAWRIFDEVRTMLIDGHWPGLTGPDWGFKVLVSPAHANFSHLIDTSGLGPIFR